MLLWNAKHGDLNIARFRDVRLFASGANKIEDKILSRGDDYDFHNFGVLEAVLAPGLIAFDIGANIGIYSVVMGRRVGPSGAVHAFEPVPHVRRKLQANLRLNGLRNVTVNPVALGAGPGTASMNAIRPGQYRAGTSTLTDNDNLDAIGRENFETIEVTVATVDDYIASGAAPRVDVIKMDVEGYELSALKGARRSLETHRPFVLMEHNQPRIRGLDLSEAEFADLFEAARYDCFEFSVVGEEVQLTPFAFDRPLRRHNIFCAPREK